MIPIFRSFTELMIMTEARDQEKINNEILESRKEMKNSGQRKRYLNSIQNQNIKLPELPISSNNAWTKPQEIVSKLIKQLDYNNQIQSSYDLTLLGIQNSPNKQDAA